MCDIKAIITFNGGSAGDFLKAVCNQQLGVNNYYLTDQGMVEFDEHYFKTQSEKIYQGIDIKLDCARVKPVENSHYYLEYFKDLTDNLFFIDYPDSAQDMIIETWKNKRFKGNLDRIMPKVLQYVPEPMRKNIHEHNWAVAYRTMMARNLVLWRSYSWLKAVPITDLFRIDQLAATVETICQQPVKDMDLLNQSLTVWLSRNQELRNFFS